MASFAVSALEQVAAWVCVGRLAIRTGDDGLDDMQEHVAVLDALRTCRRWSGLLSMRLLASLHIGRSNWARRSLVMATRANTALHAVYDRVSRAQITALLDQVHDTERQLDERDQEYEALRERYIEMMDHAQGLEMELQELRATARGD
jgi:hypothetical protein